MVDIAGLMVFAESRPSAEGEAFLAMQRSGKLAAFSAACAVLLQMFAACPSPYILSGFPRMRAQLLELQERVGKPGLAVQVGEELPGACRHTPAFCESMGVPVHVSRSVDGAAVEAVLEAMHIACVD